jgi:hypothetical protein
MQDQVNATPAPKRVPLNKGKLTGAQAATAAQTRLVHPNKTQIEGRARDQFGNRQQASWLRCRRHPSR